MSDIKKEQLFLARLQETVKKARENGGSITEQALREQFRDLSLTEDQMDQVRAYLAAAKIGVGQAPESGDVLTEEEQESLNAAALYAAQSRELEKLFAEWMNDYEIETHPELLGQ